MKTFKCKYINLELTQNLKNTCTHFKCIITPILSCQTSSSRVPCWFDNVHCRHCKVTIFISEYHVSSSKVHCKHCKVTISTPILALTDNVHCRHCKVTIFISDYLPCQFKQGALQTLQSNNLHSNSGSNRRCTLQTLQSDNLHFRLPTMSVQARWCIANIAK
jgi:hypothetical protein